MRILRMRHGMENRTALQLNENGLWAIVNGEVAFDVTGEYSYGTYYSVSGEDSIYVSYIYQVENGLVTSMQATVLDR